LISKSILKERLGINQAQGFLFSVLKKNSARAGIIILVAILSIMIGGVMLSPFTPDQVSVAFNKPPDFTHIFGTDWLGHDLFSQVAWGSYPSLFVALTGAFGSVLLGMLVGITGGYFPRLRGVMSGAGDVVMVFPAIPLLVLLGSVLPASNLFIASLILLIEWPVVSRVIRNQVISIKKRPYVDAARTSGSKERQIIFGIIVPEITPLAIAYFILNASLAVILTVSLEFLGIGDPSIASWGSILYWAQQFAFIAGDWWWVFFPGLFMALTAISFALIGVAIEEIVNPRLAA
jgi:peptide/nickel transport system permease protein